MSGAASNLNLILALLGAPTQIGAFEALPEGIKYVYLAFDCQHGPLSDYIVTSRLCAEVRRHAVLSLLPRSTEVWAFNLFGENLETQMVHSFLDETRYVFF